MKAVPRERVRDRVQQPAAVAVPRPVRRDAQLVRKTAGLGYRGDFVDEHALHDGQSVAAAARSPARR